MAAEASRSSGSVDSYIGSLISLTSKSEIRYEGILFNINTEEASIGLRNVRSFGTEGRRKDGAQVPASDKVYEYIVFRGSDIKDLQVKSSPPVQTAPPVHSDPAILQSHYAAPMAPSNLLSGSTTAASGSPSDFTAQMPQPGLPRPTCQTNVPLYPPGGALTSCNPSTPPTANGAAPSFPMYWPGYYSPSGFFQMQQQSLVRPAQDLSMSMQRASAQQPVKYPTMTSSIPPGAPNEPVSQTMEFSHPLLQPVASSTGSMLSTVLPVQSSAVVPNCSTSMVLPKAPGQVISALSQSSSSPFLSPALPNLLEKNTVASLIPSESNSISSSSLPLSNLSEPSSTFGGTSSSPALVTPGQFLQPAFTISQASQTAQKDVEVVQVSSLVSQSQAPAAAATATTIGTVPASLEAQPPLLPLPSLSNPKVNGVSSHSPIVNRGGHERGRGSEFRYTAPNFTEEFDFEAMNEKFKKEEVWGHLGKTKFNDDGVDSQDEEEVDHPKINLRAVYKKDDFFDTLSCNSLDHESRYGRPRFSEQMRLDTETFGDIPRNRGMGFRGGRGPGRGGWSRGGYYGRGYGYTGRGRGHNVYRAM